jgi:hypothetical protein
MIVYVKESPSASLPENVITVVLIAVSSGIVVLSSEITGVLSFTFVMSIVIVPVLVFVPSEISTMILYHVRVS